MPFVKLDTRILDSTLWVDRGSRDIFITALLMAEPWETTEPVPQLEVRSLNPTGFVVPAGWYGLIPASGIGIIRRSLLSEKQGYEALEALGRADQESRSDNFEGRRLVRIDGGYIVLNFMKYRERDYTSAERSKRYRERQAGSLPNPVTESHRSVTASHRDITQAEAEAEAEAERTKTTDPDGSSAGSKTTKTKNRGGHGAAEDVEKVRLAYPLKKAPGVERKAIEKAMTRLAARGESDPAGFLIARIAAWKAARDRDGAAGRFVPDCPYAATWFNQERYDAEGLQPVKNCVLPDGKLGTAAELKEQTGWQVIRGAV